MSIQWSYVAGYMYFEMAVLIILILPIIGPKHYYNFFRCRLFTTIKEHVGKCFISVLCILGMILIETLRDMQKYYDIYNLSHTELKSTVNLYRAQKNFFITGFSILLAFVIRRLFIMFWNDYEQQLKAEMILKKSQDALLLAKTRLSETKQFSEKIKKLKEIAPIQGQEKEGEVVGQEDELDTS